MDEKKEVVVVNQDANAVMTKGMEWNREQVDLIKKTVAKNTTDDELKLFLYTCKRTGLDPLIRQIYAVKRGGESKQMTIQTGIDGYRLIAERTGCYAPSREPSFVEKDGKIISATAYVKKFIRGEWHEVSATAYFDEYAQKYDGKLGAMWAKMGHVMIAKCAEALALRRAFPAEMCGVYTHEEMAQAEPVKEIQEVPQRKSETAEKTSAPKRQSDVGATGNVKGKVVEFKPKVGRGPFGVKVGECPFLLKTFEESDGETLKRHFEEGNEIEVAFEFQKSKNPDFPDNAMIKEIIVQSAVGE